MLAFLVTLGLLIGFATAQAAPAGPVLAIKAQDEQPSNALPAILNHHPGTKCRKHKAHSHRSCSHCARQVVVNSLTRSRDRNALLLSRDTQATHAECYARTAADNAARLMLARGAIDGLTHKANTVLSRTERLRN